VTSTSSNHAVRVENLSVSYGNVVAVKNASFSVNHGTLTGIMGPNGAGKSTLIKAMMGLVRFQRGNIRLLSAHPSQLDGTCIAYVPQQNHINLHFPVTVGDVVMMGRYSYMQRLRPPRARDREAVKASLKKVRMHDKKDRQIGQLSGGERQRVFLARALAQQAELFFLDEPFSDIDFASEKVIISLLRELAGGGKTIFVIHHNLDKVFEYFETLLLINGEMIAFGKTQCVFTPENLARTYRDSHMVLAHDDDAAVIPK